ncbi:ATP-dependent DNA helicase [Polyangium sp. 15x6]|uniref:ATP-dependent DNA helicase n=1 Tax=Polyangium sp. 15x6 TaxID=3042687 RepID=UPI00249C5F86|nr:ATP-dependent DNA helicase [Polyangium sp. 15x6]MDI3291063.1 ATP-dependent DNA helicase [Polyangium sp. 15x6]
MSDDEDDDVELEAQPERPGRQGRARKLLGSDGPLARAFEGYEDREGQLAMADAVERSLEEDRVLLCEAGTGTGKTLAYLVPAILSGRKVVISTATKALEEQIFAKDLPLVAEYLGLRVSAALVKGLGNYLCLRRFDELRTSPESHHDAAVSRSLPVVEAWARETEVGDLAELVTLAESDPIRREVCSSSETRIGSACPFFEKCFVTRMKREAEEARVLVVNHHLFFADLSLKLGRGNVPGAGALPPYDAVIFDEAHELEDIATEFFGTRISGSRVDSMLRDADRAFIASGLADRILGRGEGTAIVALVREAADRFFAAVAKAGGEAAREGRVELRREVWAGELVEAYHHFDEALEALGGYASAHAITEAVGLVGTRAETLRADAAKIVDGKSGQVTWVEVRARSVSVGASAVDVGWLFREGVFERIGGVVLTSATMTAKAGDFRFLRTRLGLDERVTVPVDELVVPSPFDYASRALLYTPRDLPEVSEPGFLAASADRIVELVNIVGGGAFVLCTSNRSMVALGRALAGRVPGPLMVQGQAPKRMLLSKFRAAHHAVLVATMSFWEGVDVPGDALRLVVIDKIPFAVPTDPVVVARSQAIEQAGHSPFATYTVPQAAITLKQGFGRLIRTRQDRGIVAILDRRVRTRGYGALLLDGLPPAARTERIDEVKAFWSRLLAEDAEG